MNFNLETVAFIVKGMAGSLSRWYPRDRVGIGYADIRSILWIFMRGLLPCFDIRIEDSPALCNI